MTWITDPKGCGKCDSCGMDMDMDPYCVHEKVIALRIAEPGARRSYPCGLDISRARPLCAGNFFSERKPK